MKLYSTSMIIERQGDETLFVAWHPALDGCMAQGHTIAEAIALLDEMRADHLRVAKKYGIDVPQPDAELPEFPIDFCAQATQMHMRAPALQVA